MSRYLSTTAARAQVLVCGDALHSEPDDGFEKRYVWVWRIRIIELSGAHRLLCDRAKFTSEGCDVCYQVIHRLALISSLR